jgi:hypothetical protein
MLAQSGSTLGKQAGAMMSRGGQNQSFHVHVRWGGHARSWLGVPVELEGQ